MKNIVSLIVMLSVTLASLAQAREGTVEYQKKQHPAAIIELPYSTAVVNAALNDHLSGKGRSKSNSIKGFTTYRNTQAVAQDSSNADLYFKTERKSRKESEVTIISLLLSPVGTETKDNLHYLSMNAGKEYLDGLATAIEAYNLELNIKGQNEALTRAETKYRNLVNDGRDLEKKRASIDSKIEENRKEQEQQLKEIETQKQKLAQWAGQRRSG